MIIMANKQNYTRNTFEKRKQAYKQLPILEIAQRLGIELKRTGQSYQSIEHDSLVFTPNKNKFYWNSKMVGGDTIRLVEVYKECSFKEAMKWFDKQDFTHVEVVEKQTIQEKPTFQYLLKEEPLTVGKEYLMKNRHLSEATIDYFVQKGVLKQTKRYFPEENFNEPVLAFHSYDGSGKLVGATLQGLQPYPDIRLHIHKGFLKEILTGSDGSRGVRVQTSEHPRTFVFCEATIDLMSYYELYKDQLKDAVLVSMNGLKESTIHSAFKDTFGQQTTQNAHDFFKDVTQRMNPELAKKQGFKIILAVDNDNAGNRFVENIQIENIPLLIHQPTLPPGETKRDWNEVLQKGEKNLQHAPLTKEEYWVQERAKLVSDTILQNKINFELPQKGVHRLRSFQLGRYNETQIFRILSGKDELLSIPLTYVRNQLVLDRNRKAAVKTSELFPDSFIPLFLQEVNKCPVPHPLIEHQKSVQKNVLTKEAMSITLSKQEILQQVRTLRERLLQPEVYQSFLSFLTRFPQLNIKNVGLLFAQNPKATIIATKEAWELQQKTLNEKAQPIVLFLQANPATDNQNVPQRLLFVYDKGDLTQSAEMTKNEKKEPMSEATFKNLFLSIIHSTEYKVGYQELSSTQKGYIDEANQRIIFNKNLFVDAHKRYSPIIQEVMTMVQATKVPTTFKEQRPESNSLTDLFTKSVVFATMSHFQLDCTYQKDLSLQHYRPEQVDFFLRNFDHVQEQTNQLIQNVERMLERQRVQTQTKNPIRDEIARAKEVIANAKKQEPPSRNHEQEYQKGGQFA